jgi:membrane fusion protein, multidrug efflux system
MGNTVKLEQTGYRGSTATQKLALLLCVLLGVSTHSAAKNISLDNSVQMPVRGVVRSANEAIISTDLSALITKVGFKEGEKFNTGDLLIALDCRRLHAELASAKAHHREMKVASTASLFLKKRNASSSQDVEITRAKTDQAQAKIEAILAQIDRCKIIAPYDGRVAELGVHQHEMSVAGKPLLTIVSHQQPKMELIVPSTWLRWLKAGARFRFHVDETDRQHIGQITRLGASVDTVSQTIKVFARFVNSTPDILPGMSGTAEFQHQRRGGFDE